MDMSYIEVEAEPSGEEVHEAPSAFSPWVPAKPSDATDMETVDEQKKGIKKKYLPKIKMYKAYKPLNMILWQFFGLYRWYKTLFRAYKVRGIILKYIFIFMFRGLVDKFRGEDFPRRTRSSILRNLVEDLGPTYIKFGQVISSRPNMPAEIIKEFRKLQDKAPPFSYELAAEQIRSELGAPVEELFDYFEKEPIATASIGQVHRARLKTGEKVAVKIQRPGVESVVETDIRILTRLASKLESFRSLRQLQPKVTVDAFSNALRRELDYIIEGRSADRFAMMYANDDTVYIPKVYWEYSTKRVLTLEFIEGVKPDEVWRIEELGLDRRQIAINAVQAYMKQIFNYGFFHADPHASNVFIMENNVVAFIDFGMMGRADKGMRNKFADLLIGIMQRDVDGMLKTILDLVETTEDTELNAMRNDMIDFLDRHYTPSGRILIYQRGVGSMMDELILGILKHNVILPEDIILLVKVFVYAEGIGVKLDPDFDPMQVISPFLHKMGEERVVEMMDPMGLRRGGVKEAAVNLMTYLGRTSNKISSILDKMEEGEFTLNIENKSEDMTMIKTYKLMNYQLALSIILAALIIGFFLTAM